MRSPSKEEENERFIERVIEVVNRGGTALVRICHRRMNVVMLLHKYLPELNVHVDGMGKRGRRLQMDLQKPYETHQHLVRLALVSTGLVNSTARKPDADVIVSTSGMLDGGPSVWYLNRLRHDARMRSYSQDIKPETRAVAGYSKKQECLYSVNSQALSLDVDQYSFSTHAGHQEIVQFAEECQAEDVVIQIQTWRPPLAENSNQKTRATSPKEWEI